MPRASLVVLLGCWNNVQAAEGLKAETVSLFLQKPTSAESPRAQSFGALRGRSLPPGGDQLQGKQTVSVLLQQDQKVKTLQTCLFNRTSSL